MKRIDPPIGHKFSQWTVIAKGSTSSLWLCRCDCGREKFVHHTNLRQGKSTKCHGCVAREHKHIHGESAGGGKKCSSEYLAYIAAKARCTRPNHRMYAYYGGRGIEFRFNSYMHFISTIGHKPSPAHSLDRINNNGHYEPGNVKWATKQEQIDNRRTTLRITFQGKTQSVSMWGRELGLDAKTLQSVRQHIVKGDDPVASLLVAISKSDRKSEHSTTKQKYQHPPKHSSS